MHALILFLAVTDVGPRPQETPQPADIIDDSAVTDVAVHAISARSVGFTEALQLAASQNPAVAAARADAAVVAASVRRAAGAWQPDLTANGIYDHTTAAQY